MPLISANQAGWDRQFSPGSASGRGRARPSPNKRGEPPIDRNVAAKARTPPAMAGGASPRSNRPYHGRRTPASAQDFQYLEPLFPLGQVHADDFADASPHQGLAHRGILGHLDVIEAEGTAGGADEAVDVFVLGLDVAQFDGRADEHNVVGHGRLVEDTGGGQALLEVSDLGLVYVVGLAGGVVLGVFAPVAQFAGGPDAFGKFLALGFEFSQLGLKPSRFVGGDEFHRWRLVHARGGANPSAPLVQVNAPS